MEHEKLQELTNEIGEKAGRLIQDEINKHRLLPVEQFNLILSINVDMIDSIMNQAAAQTTVDIHKRVSKNVISHLEKLFEESLKKCIKANKEKGKH